MGKKRTEKDRATDDAEVDVVSAENAGGCAGREEGGHAAALSQIFRRRESDEEDHRVRLANRHEGGHAQRESNKGRPHQKRRKSVERRESKVLSLYEDNDMLKFCQLSQVSIFW